MSDLAPGVREQKKRSYEASVRDICGAGLPPGAEPRGDKD